MNLAPATSADVDQAISCLAAAFARDPITGYLLENGSGYHERVTKFLSLLMRARIALAMPVVVARDATGIHGAVMGYATTHPAWPGDITEEWDRFEKSVPGMTERLATYEGIVEKFKPPAPHYYLGVIGTEPALHGRGIGTRLIRAFCDISASDSSSSGVYLETAQPSNVRFYEGAGFKETGRARLGDGTLWCMFHPHGTRA